MTDNNINTNNENTSVDAEQVTKTLSPEAQRALAEAEERRNANNGAEMPTEYGGRGGVEPTRFGDWEKSGIAHDF